MSPVEPRTRAGKKMARWHQRIDLARRSFCEADDSPWPCRTIREIIDIEDEAEELGRKAPVGNYRPWEWSSNA